MQRQINELKNSLYLLGERVEDLEKLLKGSPKTGSSVEMMIRDREYERVISEMKQIANTYGDHQNWSKADTDRHRLLRLRRDELRKVLGIKV